MKMAEKREKITIREKKRETINKMVERGEN